jgi:Uri superfamily endonuclease
MPLDKLSSNPGNYILIFKLNAEKKITIGKLTQANFPSGTYAYVGSAFGPGGVAARVSRHARDNKKDHWHIDYFAKWANLTEIWWTTEPHIAECELASTLAISASRIVHRFGASDCSCEGHLLLMQNKSTAWKTLAADGRCVMKRTSL